MRAHSRYGHKSELINVVLQTKLPAETRVAIGSGALQEIERLVTQSGAGKKLAVLCQPSITQAWANPAVEQLSKSFDCAVLELPDGEQCKTHEQLLKIWAFLIDRQLERSDCLIAIGGGALTDIAAFAASTYLRGIKLVLVPTTLLAQVDAAIGGKTAINLPAGKNLAGSFFFPTAVIVDPDCLSTLPRRELLSGLGEIIKYALIENTVAEQTEYRTGPMSLLKILKQLIGSGAFSAESAELAGIIAACIKMKLAVVATDPKENGLRRSLNLGHTLGHAIEKVSRYQIKHGEAIAIGMVFACKLAESGNKLAGSETGVLVDLLEKAGLPTTVDGNLPKDELINAMSFDKKRRGGQTRFVLPIENLGRVNTDVPIGVDQLQAAL